MLVHLVTLAGQCRSRRAAVTRRARRLELRDEHAHDVDEEERVGQHRQAHRAGQDPSGARLVHPAALKQRKTKKGDSLRCLLSADTSISYCFTYIEIYGGLFLENCRLGGNGNDRNARHFGRPVHTIRASIFYYYALPTLSRPRSQHLPVLVRFCYYYY